MAKGNIKDLGIDAYYTLWGVLLKVLPFEWFYNLIEDKIIFKIKFSTGNTQTFTAKEGRYGYKDAR